MSWKKLLESVSESLHDHLQLRNEYLLTENRILLQQINGCVQLIDSERKELAELGAKLGKKALAEIATVAQPDTILAWNRKFADHKVETSQPLKSVGRPRVDQEIEDLVIRMAHENRSWGYNHIQGALKNLGYSISDQTVSNILKRYDIPTAPERKKTVTWWEFTRSHLDMLLATDFFNSEAWSWCRLVISYLFCFIHCSRDHIHALEMLLRRQMQRIRSFVLWLLDVSTHGHRWVRLGRPSARSRALRGGEGGVGSPVSQFASSPERLPGGPAMGQVVFLSIVRHRQIRDGPMPRRQRFDGLLKDDGRQAA